MVHRAVRRCDKKEVALKVIRTTDEDKIAMVKEEFSLLQRLDHPNIARAIDLCVFSDQAVLVESLCIGSPLGTALKQHKKDKRLSEAEAHKLFVMMLEALDHCHQRRIVHRDIKPENVMVNDTFTDLKLIDFSIARFLPEGGSLSPIGTPLYAAPEVRNGGSPSEASDVWGAGLCLFLMLFGRCPRVNRQALEVTLSSTQVSMISETCRTTLQKCLAFDYSMRPAAMILLQADWLQYGPPDADVFSGDPLSPRKPSATLRRIRSFNYESSAKDALKFQALQEQYKVPRGEAKYKAPRDRSFCISAPATLNELPELLELPEIPETPTAPDTPDFTFEKDPLAVEICFSMQTTCDSSASDEPVSMHNLPDHFTICDAMMAPGWDAVPLAQNDPDSSDDGGFDSD
jgi:serine/threonine protein kinase